MRWFRRAFECHAKRIHHQTSSWWWSTKGICRYRQDEQHNNEKLDLIDHLDASIDLKADSQMEPVSLEEFIPTVALWWTSCNIKHQPQSLPGRVIDQNWFVQSQTPNPNLEPKVQKQFQISNSQTWTSFGPRSGPVLIRQTTYSERQL